MEKKQSTKEEGTEVASRKSSEQSELRYMVLPELDPESITYIEKGFLDIIKTNNCASLKAFPNSVINERGLFFDKESFERVIKTFEIDFNLGMLPEKFMIKIRKSPISLFKRWLLTITNKPLLAIGQQVQGYSRDFFPLFLRNHLTLQVITTNVAHERLLLAVYSRKKIEDYEMTINTHLLDGKKFVIYKDYAKKKISTLKLKKTLDAKRPHHFNIKIVRELSKIRFNVRIDHQYSAEHLIRFKRPVRASYNEQAFHDNKKFYKKNEKEVIGIIETHNGKMVRTNNYANISLGRVARIPILITLPNKEINANVDVKLEYDAETRMVRVYDQKKNILKEMALATPPKSNWLRRLRK